MEAIGYIRQSKRADLDVALSYDTQLAAIRKLAEADGLDPDSVRIFADMGRSGAAGKERLRPAYQEALALLEAGGVGTIYSLTLTRIARSAGELERVLGICERGSIRVVTQKEGVNDPTNPMQSALFGMIGVFAKFERDLAVQRAKDNANVRRARGERMGRVPYGERPGDRPDLVLAAWETSGGSLNGTARLLNEQKVPTWQGVRVRNGVTEAVEWTGPAVRLVMQRLKPGLLPGRVKRGVKPTAGFLLYRLLLCPCGRILTASKDARGNNDVVYRCHDATIRSGHRTPTGEDIRSYRTREALVLPWVKAEYERLRKIMPKAVELTAKDGKRRAELEAERVQVLDMFQLRGVSHDEVQARLDRIATELDAIEVRATLEPLPAIDWSWPVATINGILRALWDHIDLDLDLVPVEAVTRVPELRTA